MNEHPINDLFKISLSSIKEMIDVDTVVGEAVSINENVSVIPISKVKCSFATGGTDHKSNNKDEDKVPFGGALGGTVAISPVAFIVINKNEVKMLHIDEDVHIYEKLIDSIPDAIEVVKDMFSKGPKVKNIEIIERK